ncbi:hypothetical protein BKA00_000278 [Actinomadura coerulea]|uniref:Uncharacterized protein n=1 Tax=Actinomadura coerulea TaxID=46159 RepID=A0A7X0KWQ5_9ACTN|nr:hypothetical protein [Actinomadura coerulea]MBB6393364.1 hypothetical protein [Actinomadura coerulea]GGQ38144.1 hypothetical protein GCM10010187_65050 [Actinomadura coerulea]
MTVSVHRPAERPRVAHAGPGRARLAVCAATIAACAPYLTIKIAWLSGSTVGWNDAAAAEDSALYVGNAITLAMDAAAVLVAAAFTFRWGRRIPAWLVLAPIWIAVGLLAPIVLAVPLGTLLQTFFSSEPLMGDENALQGWVYGVVYTGFTLQGIGLLTAFVLYARERWPRTFEIRTASVPKGPTHSLQVLLARVAVAPAAVFAAVQLFWASGGTAGLHGGEATDRNLAQQLADGAEGLLAVAAAAALVLIVRRAGRPGRFAVPLAAAWAGSGTMFAASLYGLLVVLGRPGFLAPDTASATGLVALAGVLAGLVTGLTGAFLLAENQSALAGGQSARPTASSTP